MVSSFVRARLSLTLSRSDNMNAEEIINAIQSTDLHEVWLASWELIRMKNSNGIQTIAEVLLPISDSLTPFPVPKGTHVRDYRYAPKLALEILACHAADKCRCSIYESCLLYTSPSPRDRG